METYGFALSGLGLPGDADPTGLWEVQMPSPPVPAPGEAPLIAFGAPAPLPPPTWEVRLPAAREAAVALLQAQSRAQRLADQDLARAQADLAAFGRPSAVAFGSPDPLHKQKADLQVAVERLRPSAVAYATPPRLDPEEQEATSQWERFAAEVQRMVTHYARIQTTIGETTVGLTMVGWTGDFATHWAPGNAAIRASDAAALHMQAVQVALDSRMALIRVASVVAAGAIGLTVKAAIPGGQITLLPAVWRFVRDVLRTLRQSWPQLQNLVGRV